MFLMQLLDMFHIIAVHLDFFQGDGHPSEEGHHQQAAENNDEEFHGRRAKSGTGCLNARALTIAMLAG